jgi:hypothetical protein
MAIHRGRVIVGTLPTGRVHAMRVGIAASTGRGIDSGDHHVAAVRRGPSVELYVDGLLAASETDPADAVLDLGTLGRVRSSGGPRAAFAGRSRDLRLDERALAAPEIAALARLGLDR